MHVHVTDLEWEDNSHGETYGAKRRYLARAAGLQQLGASMYTLPPGKADWPLHFHHANEEAFYFLEGEGTVRTPGGDVAVRPGSFVGAKRVAADAHQVVNTGSSPLVFLCFSGMVAPDVTEYPESGKLGVFCGAPPGSRDEDRTVNEVHERKNAVDYW